MGKAETKVNEEGKTTEGNSVTRLLPCKLTQEEVVRKADEISSHHADVSKYESEKKAATDRFKTLIEHAEEQIADLVREVRTRSEIRDVQCTEIYDHAIGVVHIRRNDTEEIVETRTMSEEEKQTKLFSIDGGKSPKTVTFRTKHGKVTVSAKEASAGIKAAVAENAADDAGA